MEDGGLSSNFRENLRANHASVLSFSEGVERSLSLISHVEAQIYENIGKLYLPFLRIFKDGELNTFIQYSQKWKMVTKYTFIVSQREMDLLSG